MKTIGILTMHRVLNYGSILQTWATQQVLKQLGYQTYIIDYLYPNKNHKKTTKINVSLILCFARFLKNVIQRFPLKKKQIKFQHFIYKNLNLSKPYKTKDSLNIDPPIYDIYLAGSDQIWNPTHIGNDTTFFLDFVPENKKLVSYASSFAQSSLSDNYMREIRPFLKKFNAISVREKNGQTIIKKILNIDVPICLDPTLLLSTSEYHLLEKQSKLKLPSKYILVYILKYAFNPYPYVTKFIKEAYKQMHLPIICLDFSSRQFLGIRNIINLHDSVGPEDFVKLFLNASMVITSSFHGTAFSLNFNKSVYSITDNGDKDDRISNLLTICGIPERIIKLGSSIPEFSLHIDSKKVKSSLSLLKKESINYLERNL